MIDFRNYFALILGLIIVTAAATRVVAQNPTHVWTGAGNDGVFENPLNWDADPAGTIPGNDPGDVFQIDLGQNDPIDPYTVTLSDNIAVYMGTTETGYLTFRMEDQPNQSSYLAADYRLYFSSAETIFEPVNGQGVVVQAGTYIGFNYDYGHTVSVLPGSGGEVQFIAPELNNETTFNVSGPLRLTVDSVFNDEDAEFNVQANGGVQFDSSVEFTNQYGDISIDGSTALELPAGSSFTDIGGGSDGSIEGSIRIYEGTLTLEQNGSTGGTFEMIGGGLVTDGTDNSGPTIDPDRTLRFIGAGGNGAFEINVELNNSGVVEVTSDDDTDVVVTNGKIQGGVLNIEAGGGGARELQVDIQDTAINFNADTTFTGQEIYSTQDVYVAPDVTVEMSAGGQFLGVDDGHVLIDGDWFVRNGSQVMVTGGEMTIYGRLVLEGGTTFEHASGGSISGLVEIDAGALTMQFNNGSNAGSYLMTGGGELSGTIPTGTDIRLVASSGAETYVGNLTLENYGIIELLSSDNSTFVFEAEEFINAGGFGYVQDDPSGETRYFRANYLHNQSGAGFEINNDFEFDSESMTIDNEGDFYVNAGTARLSGNYQTFNQLDGQLSIEPGLEFQVTGTGSRLNYEGGNIYGTVRIINAEVYASDLANGKEFILSGSSTAAGDWYEQHSAIIEGSAEYGDAVGYDFGGFVHGSITLTSTHEDFSAAMDPGGPLYVYSSGYLGVEQGAGGGRSILTTQITNEGTIQIDAATFIQSDSIENFGYIGIEAPVVLQNQGGDIVNRGVLYLSASGSITSEGGFTTDDYENLSELIMTLGGTEYSRLVIGKELQAHAPSILRVLADFDFVPQVGQVFDLLDFTIFEAGFSDVELPTLPDGMSWDISNLYITGEIGVVPEPASGLLLVMALPVLVAIRRRRRAVRSGYSC